MVLWAGLCDSVESTTVIPEVGQSRGRETQTERAQWQQPAGFPGPPHPGSQSPAHKGGSVPTVPTAHIRAACPPPPSPWAWQQHWVTQPQAGDNDHTVGSHTCTAAERLRISTRQPPPPTLRNSPFLPSVQPVHPRPCPPLPVTQGEESASWGFHAPSPTPQHTPVSICTVHRTFPASLPLS